MVVQNLFYHLISCLSESGIPSPRLEARILLAYILGCEADEINSDVTLNDIQQKRLDNLLKRRLNHEPLDKIIGVKGFYKYDFEVNNQVLSPRPDTEILLEAALDIIRKNNFLSVMELGVGSGCVILSLLAECPNLKGFGADKSLQALAVAKKNACRLEVEDRIDFQEFDYFSNQTEKKFDIIITNPPYIPSGDIALLDEEVKSYDPLMALDGGKDGLDHYRQIAKVGYNWLNKNGFLLLECGIGQAEDIVSIFENKHWKKVNILQDLGGINRCIIFKK